MYALLFVFKNYILIFCLYTIICTFFVLLHFIHSPITEYVILKLQMFNLMILILKITES